MAERRFKDKKDRRWMRVKVAKILSRIMHARVSSGQLFTHPCCQQRDYILNKLLQFQHEHKMELAQRQRDLEAAIAQLPARTCAEESKPLREQLDELARRRRGPQPLAELLPIVLARLQAHVVESNAHEGAGP
jgi:hypothetical protein